jgi:hypothetical protein
MTSDYEQILDRCIDRINLGERLEDCLVDYPQYASQLEPLLRTMSRTQQAFAFSPSPVAKREARQAFLAAMDRQRQPSFWQKFFGNRLVWAAAATAVLVLFFVGYIGFRTTISPPEPTTVTVASAAPNGNFIFLMTDEVNAINEFSRLDVKLEKVALLYNGDSRKWVEFVPETKQFDLTLLPNGITQQLWQGDLPEGQYSMVRLYVSQAQGSLKADGSTVNVKIPSDRVQFDVPASFQIRSENVTKFTYDLTIFSTGKGQGSEKYHLKPIVNQSKIFQEPRPNQYKSKANKD